MLVGAVANIILDYLFVIIFDWGIGGAAWATIIAQGLSMAWVLYYFFSGSSELKIKMHHLKLRLDLVWNIVKIGFPMFGMQLAGSLIGLIMNRSLLKYGGDVAISAMGIISSISTFIMMPIFGINQGLQPIVGYNYGAKRTDRVREGLMLALCASSAIILLWFIVMQFFSRNMIRLFNKDDMELIILGARAMRIYFILLPVLGFQIVSTGYFQAVGKATEATFLSLSRQLIFFLPALLILPRFFGLDGIIYTGPVCDGLSAIITAIIFIREMKHLKNSEIESAKIEEQQPVRAEAEL